MVAALSLAALAAVFWSSGVITPHIHWGATGLFTYVDENGELTTHLTIDVENEGITPFVLTGISTDIPGMRFADTETKEVTVSPGGFEMVKATVVITDCTAVPHEPQPLRYSYRTWLRSGTAETVWDSPRIGGVPIAWQQWLSTGACSEAVRDVWP